MVDKVQIRKPYGPRRISQILCPQEEMVTEQHHKQACDIGHIIRQYDKTGLIEHVNRSKAIYGDFTEVNEYQESLNIVIRAQDAFNEIPADIRKKFGNDPGAFFEFATDPANAEEMVKMGLAEPLREAVSQAPTQPENPPADAE